MVLSILTFELSRRLRRISTYIYFLVFFGLAFLFVLMSGGAFATATVDFGTGGKVLVTSPFALNAIIMYISFFGVVVTAAHLRAGDLSGCGQQLDGIFLHGSDHEIRLPCWTFSGALAVQFVIFASVGLGAWVGTLMPWLDPARVGPQRLFAYVQPYFTLVIPNLILTTAIFFAWPRWDGRCCPFMRAASFC